jgi:GT2 family glycosyltransferase
MPARQDRLVAVVVTYNRLAKLRVTLARLLEAPEAELAAVLVVDNASRDGTGDWLDSLDDPRLSVCRNAENIGGAGGFEQGMREAVQRWDPDWIVVMDDDARPEPGALAAFHALDKTGQEGVAAAVYFPDGSICGMNSPSRNPFWHAREFIRTLLGGGRGGFHLSEADYAGPGRQIDVTSFVGFFVSRAAIARSGFPEGRLFVYGEDALFTLGLSRAGARLWFAPEIRFEHDCSTFSGHRVQPLWKVYYFHRNLLMLYRLAAGWLFWPVLLVILPRWLFRARHYGKDRRVFLRLLSRAVRDGLTRRTELSHADVLALTKG